MAYSDLAPNQYITFGNANTCGFPILHPLPLSTQGQQFMTKDDVLYYLNVAAADLNVLTSGSQWPWKALLSSGRATAWRGITPFCVQTTPASKSVGDQYGGGVVAYILAQNDVGYDANIQKGIIAAPSDQSAGIAWWNGSNTTTGATSTARGNGQANTDLIIASQGNTGNYAAKLCADLSLNGFTDWYLPTLNESAALRTNKAIIGNFGTGEYHNSTEITSSVINVLHFLDESLHGVGKDEIACVRAVRSFRLDLSNTGYKGWTTLEQYYTDNGAATGTTKSNTVGQADYIAPIQDLTACALSTFYITISPSSRLISYLDQVANFNIVTNYPSYTITSNASWCPVANYVSGSPNQNIELMVIQNVKYTVRTADISIITSDGTVHFILTQDYEGGIG